MGEQRLRGVGVVKDIADQRREGVLPSNISVNPGAQFLKRRKELVEVELGDQG
jgi:hypothetical protein